MPKPAIKVEGLWKEYTLGAAQRAPGTFYELLSRSINAPFQRLRKGAGAAAEVERFWALRDVKFELQRGDVLGVIGRNGAGKSTLLKILSRITPPTRGRVEINGRLSSLLEVGTGFHPELSGRENIFLNGAILGMARAEGARKFDEIVAFAEVAKFVDTPVKRYSSGMYVRLAFAVAAHLEPDVLIIDEVLAVGDAEFQKRCLGKMREVATQGRTVIFVSHNLNAIQALCPASLLLNQGQLTAAGRTADVVAAYAALSGSSLGVTVQGGGQVDLIDASAAYSETDPGQCEIAVDILMRVVRGAHDLYVDFGVETERGVRLIQVMPKLRQEVPSHAASGSTLQFRAAFRAAPLAPGRYQGTVFVHTPDQAILLHVSNIPLFVVPARADRPRRPRPPRQTRVQHVRADPPCE